MATRDILVLFGPPGAGKGTHSPAIEEGLKIPQLSTGDMLRDAVDKKTSAGVRAKAAMDAGKLVKDDIVISIIADRIKESDCAKGFILDGFPRTIEQAHALDKILQISSEQITRVVNFQIPDEVLEERICGRWIHKKSGRSYHTKFNPPKSMAKDGTMKDDVTGEDLMQRSDDTADKLKTRLQSYHKSTMPVLAHYDKRPLMVPVVKHVEANREIGQVAAAVAEAVGLPPPKPKPTPTPKAAGTPLSRFVNFINKTEGRDKFGKVIQFWLRAGSYYLRQVDGTHSPMSQQMDHLWKAIGDGRQVGWLGKSLVEWNTIQNTLVKAATSKDPMADYITIAARFCFLARWAIENYRILGKFTKTIVGAQLIQLNKLAKKCWLAAIVITLLGLIRKGESMLKVLLTAGDAAAALHVSEIYPTNDGVVGVCVGVTALYQSNNLYKAANKA